MAESRALPTALPVGVELNLTELSKGRALDECLHHFLEQCLAGKHKNLLVVDRAQGLASASASASASFWFDVNAVAQSELARLALSCALHSDNAVSVELLLHLASPRTRLPNSSWSGSPAWAQSRSEPKADKSRF
jgi:hypothetical protein